MKNKGFTILEFFIIIAIIGIIVVATVPLFRSDPEVTKRAARKHLSGNVKIICIEGFDYIYIDGTRAVLAPKFNSEGQPARCENETKGLRTD